MSLEKLSSSGGRAMPGPSKQLKGANRRILVCTGAACRGHGAARLVKHIRRLARDTSIVVVATGCVRLCNRAPNLVMYPDGVWLSGITKQAVEALLKNPENDSEWEPWVSFRKNTWDETD